MLQPPNGNPTRHPLRITLLLILGTLGCIEGVVGAPAPRLYPAGAEAVLTQFKTIRTAEHTQIRFQIDGPIQVQKVGLRTTRELEILLTRTRTKLPSPASVDTGPVQGLRFEPSGADLRVVVQLTCKVDYSLSQERDALVLDLTNPPLEKLVSLNLDNEPLGRVLLMLSRQYGANIVAGSDVQGTVSIHLTDVPLKVALDQILAAEGYRYEEMPGGVLRVVRDERKQKLQEVLQQAEQQTSYHIVALQYAPASEVATLLQSLTGESGGIVASDRTNTLIINTTQDQWVRLEPILRTLDQPGAAPEKTAEEQAVAETQQRQQEQQAEETPPPPQTEALRSEILRLSYADPQELRSILTPLLSPQGMLLVLGEEKQSGGRMSMASSRLGASVAVGGTLLVRDLPEIVAQIRQIADEMDVPVTQVEIQAYIVEGTLTREESMGIDWRAVDGDNELSASLPFGGQFPALRLRVGNLSAQDFAGVLQMISSRSDTRILSNPRIVTVSGRPATFQSGDQIPYNEVVITQNVESVATGFKDTGIILEVTANVKRDDMISLTLVAEVSDVSGFTPTGQPRITGRSASTQVLVRDGDTAVLGGLVMNRNDETISKVPLLGDIPLIGQLFRTRNTRQVKSEVTVFITPRIVRASR